MELLSWKDRDVPDHKLFWYLCRITSFLFRKGAGRGSWLCWRPGGFLFLYPVNLDIKFLLNTVWYLFQNTSILMLFLLCPVK